MIRTTPGKAVEESLPQARTRPTAWTVEVPQGRALAGLPPDNERASREEPPAPSAGRRTPPQVRPVRPRRHTPHSDRREADVRQWPDDSLMCATGATSEMPSRCTGMRAWQRRSTQAVGEPRRETPRTRTRVRPAEEESCPSDTARTSSRRQQWQRRERSTSAGSARTVAPAAPQTSARVYAATRPGPSDRRQCLIHPRRRRT